MEPHYAADPETARAWALQREDKKTKLIHCQIIILSMQQMIQVMKTTLKEDIVPLIIRPIDPNVKRFVVELTCIPKEPFPRDIHVMFNIYLE